MLIPILKIQCLHLDLMTNHKLLWQIIVSIKCWNAILSEQCYVIVWNKTKLWHTNSAFSLTCFHICMSCNIAHSLPAQHVQQFWHHGINSCHNLGLYKYGSFNIVVNMGITPFCATYNFLFFPQASWKCESKRCCQYYFCFCQYFMDGTQL